MKIETLVLAFFLQTLLFSVEIRGGGQITNQTGLFNNYPARSRGISSDT